LRVGASRPIYCLQTHLGDVQAYAAVAEHVPRALTLLGLRYGGGARTLKQRYPDLQALARLFVARIVAHDPRGPYSLLGYSWGGLLAYEVSRQLIADGRRVAFLGLVGTEQQALPMERTLSRLRRARVPRELVAMIRRRGARWLGVGRRDAISRADSDVTPHTRLGDLHFELGAKYRTRSGGPQVIHLIRERELPAHYDPYGLSPEERWRLWTGADVRVYWTTGTHDTCMTPAHAQQTARRIVDAVRDAIPGTEDL
ncbi:MAG: thioesterase domain-containing protein, partial [Polyangiales bacterium]